MQKGFVNIIDVKEEPKPQTSSNGSMDGGKVKAPPHTPYKKRQHKIGDRVKTRRGYGVVIKIRGNGHTDYLVQFPRLGGVWFSEFEL